MKRQIGIALAIGLASVSFPLRPASAGLRNAVDKPRGEQSTFDTAEPSRASVNQNRGSAQAQYPSYPAQDGRRYSYQPYSYQPSSPAQGQKVTAPSTNQRDAVSKARN